MPVTIHIVLWSCLFKEMLIFIWSRLQPNNYNPSLAIPSLCLSFSTNLEQKVYRSQMWKFGAHLGGDNLIRFWVLCDALNTTTKIFHFPGILQILFKLPTRILVEIHIICPNEIFSLFWIPGGAIFSFKKSIKILHYSYLRDFMGHTDLKFHRKTPYIYKQNASV